MHQKPSDAGWFYHAPVRNVKREPVGAPPPSQIPGLGDIEPLIPDVPKEMFFKETDTKYVRLAKMGGRKDLLTIKPNPEGKKEPVPYHRTDWFYLEDNALEDKRIEKQEEPWQFLLPDYMVHEAYGSTTVDGSDKEPTIHDGNTVPMRRAPYAIDDQMAQFNREGQSMTDKTVRLQETRRPGYGIRNGKPPPKAPLIQDKTKPMSSQVQGQRPRLKFQALPGESNEPISMAKLISNTYEREWHDKLSTWQEQQKQNHAQTLAKGDEQPAHSEYHSTYSNHSKSAASSSRAVRRGPGEHQQNKAPAKNEEEKEPFKMSRFKNIPARINSHQSPDMLAAVGN